MLSDAIKQMRDRFGRAVTDDSADFLLTLRAFELEARNMEDRLFHLTGRPHAVLDDRLMSAPAIEIGQRHVV